MYYDGCKFGKSEDCNVRKFKLKKGQEDHEAQLESVLQRLTTEVTPMYARVAPDSFDNMTAFSEMSDACRIGHNPLRERPFSGKRLNVTVTSGSVSSMSMIGFFSGITAVSDFCAHAHRDVNNMNAGCTVVVTLTKPENRQVVVKPDDEQLHVLPHYGVDLTDEHGSAEGQMSKVRTGALEVLDRFDRKTILRSKPAKSKCKRGHPTVSYILYTIHSLTIDFNLCLFFVRVTGKSSWMPS